jgi:DNA-binding transcriptional LysR family regulator/post-segregation antitoxin (ccd killing protein)
MDAVPLHDVILRRRPLRLDVGLHASAFPSNGQARAERQDHELAWTQENDCAIASSLAWSKEDGMAALAWDDFRLVKAIADARGLAGAAAALGIDHSTLYRRLGQIEAAVGTRLFERRRGGYLLTPAGEEMAAAAGRVGDEITGFTRKLAGREPAPAGELRVATNDTLLVHLLTPLFVRFRERYPEIRLEIAVGNPPLNLSRRDADVAIRVTAAPPETLVGRRVAHIAWALYGRAADFPAPEPPRLEALLDRAWVAPGDDLASLPSAQFLRQRVDPKRVVYKVGSVLGLAEAVEAGLGIGHLPCFVAGVRPALVRLAPPEPGFAADLWLLTHADLRHSARVRVFLDMLATDIARERALLEGT